VEERYECVIGCRHGLESIKKRFESSFFWVKPTMPHGTAVVDALKSKQSTPPFFPSLTLSSPDLIRHGKHHYHAKPDPPPRQHAPEALATVPPPDTNPPPPAASRGLRHQQPPQSPPREMVESIVIEERKAKETMPIFKGLEDYRLEEKMGESVSFLL